MLVHQYSDVNQRLAYRDKHSAQCSRMDDMSIKLLSCIVIMVLTQPFTSLYEQGISS